jgi:hypothetical protein
MPSAPAAATRVDRTGVSFTQTAMTLLEQQLDRDPVLGK